MLQEQCTSLFNAMKHNIEFKCHFGCVVCDFVITARFQLSLTY